MGKETERRKKREFDKNTLYTHMTFPNNKRIEKTHRGEKK